jgi:hypothetical protein
MPQVFHPAANPVFRGVLFGALLIVTGALWLVLAIQRTPYVTDQGVIRDQPVPFSHKHHVGDAGLDCRYCHTSVETSSFAGIPPTQTCLNCHSFLWADANVLEPVRASWRETRPIRWTRVHDLPDFCYFDHSIHLHKGIGCVSCHGRVDQMPLMWREATLHMQWCLDCHRNPAPHIRPRDKVFDMTWIRSDDPEESPERLMERYNVQVKTDCSVCHR